MKYADAVRDYGLDKPDLLEVRAPRPTQVLLTTEDNKESILVMDTETGAAVNELSLRRQQKNWKLSVDSITPMMKFEQYRQTAGIALETRRMDILEKAITESGDLNGMLDYVFKCVMRLITDVDFRDLVLKLLAKLYTEHPLLNSGAHPHASYRGRDAVSRRARAPPAATVCAARSRAPAGRRRRALRAARPHSTAASRSSADARSARATNV